MPDAIGNKTAHDYHLDVPAPEQGFFAKGLGHGDWGAKNRLSHLFNPKSGNTVMLAFDHGYIMGPTAGLERIDLVIPPLIPYVDVLMGTRGVIHSCISPTAQVGKCVRVTYDSTVLFDDMSNGGGFACDIDSVIRLNADCMAVQTFIGAAGESRSLELLARTADAGTKYGIPTLGVVAVGKDMERTDRFFKLATRIVPRWACSWSRPTTATTLKRLWRPARCPLWWPAARSCPRTRPSRWPTVPFRAAHAAWIWAATSSRATTLWR